MEDFFEPRGYHYSLIRQCTGTNRAGERCQRNAIPGGSVCVMHGGAIPQTIAAAKRRLLEAVEPAIARLLSYIEAPPGLCAHCGRSDDTAAIVSASKVVLDRAGLHPSLTVQVQPAANPYENFSIDETITKLEDMLASARNIRDQRLAQAATLREASLDAFVIPDDEPIQDGAARFPLGTRTPEASTAEISEKPEENEENEADDEPR